MAVSQQDDKIVRLSNSTYLWVRDKVGNKPFDAAIRILLGLPPTGRKRGPKPRNKR